MSLHDIPTNYRGLIYGYRHHHSTPAITFIIVETGIITPATNYQIFVYELKNGNAILDFSQFPQFMKNVIDGTSVIIANNLLSHENVIEIYDINGDYMRTVSSSSQVSLIYTKD